MAFVPDSTDPAFNAYCDILFADDYHEYRLHNSVYKAATVEDKEAAIVWATRLIDTLTFAGVRTDPMQPRQFPRTGICVDLTCTGEYDPLVIPRILKEATAELALLLLTGDPTGVAGTTSVTSTNEFKKIVVDTIELEYNTGDPVTFKGYGGVSWMTPAISGLLAGLLPRTSSLYVARVIRT